MRLRQTCWVLAFSLSAAACGADASTSEPGAADRPGQAPTGEGTSSSPSGTGDANPSGAPADGAPKPDGCLVAAAKPGNLDLTITSGGRQRAARVHIPPGYDGAKPTPVLLNFHGRMSTPSQEELISETTPKSDKAGFVVVYPTGIGQTWNAGLCCGQAQTENIDDVGFTRALLDELETKLCVDKKRVFATGLSNGAFMVNRLACELADRIAAIGPVAGQLLTACKPSRPVPVMHFHGTADSVVSYTGQFGLPGVESAVKGWATRNGCAATPKQTYSKGDATCVTYDGCTSNADVTLCTIAEGGHTWPGGFAVPGLGKTSKDIDATDAMWDFFTKHPMP